MTDRPLRVLYIDDDPALGRLVQKTLARRGYEVESVTDAAAGPVVSVFRAAYRAFCPEGGSQ